MAEFQHSVIAWYGLLQSLGTIYFLVVGFSSLAAAYLLKVSAAASAPTPSPTQRSPPPTPSPADCSPEEVWAQMDLWLRWASLLLVLSYLFAYYAKKMVEIAAADEALHYKDENDAYKALCKKVEQLESALEAMRKPFPADVPAGFDEALQVLKNAQDMAELKKPKKGLARVLLRATRRWMRGIFLTAIICLFSTGLCSAVSFYLSLQMRFGCKNGAAEVCPFLFVGTFFLLFHLEAGWVAVTAD